MTNEMTVHLADEFDSLRPEFAKILPPGMNPAKFAHVCATAIEQDPALLDADRHSLFLACKRAAMDGLLPDKRQGALVIFNVNEGTREKPRWAKKVQWMPMRQGLIDKAAKYGISIDSQCVFENDEFSYVMGDEPCIRHTPNLKDRGDLVGAYAIATMADGKKKREFMDLPEIEKVRAVSKSKDSGPWRDWYTEQARKSVIRRLFKSLAIADEIPERDRKVFTTEDDIQLPAPEQAPQIEMPKAKSALPPADDQPPKAETPTNGNGKLASPAQVRLLRAKLGQQDLLDEGALCAQYEVDKLDHIPANLVNSALATLAGK